MRGRHSVFVAIYAALQKKRAAPVLVILGNMSIQGNIKSMQMLTEPLRLVIENGCYLALIPLEKKRSLLDISEDVIDRMDSIFYSDPLAAALKGLGMK